MAITLRLERRQDGGLRVFSDDVPGFVLSHREPELVCADIWPALRVIAPTFAGDGGSAGIGDGGSGC